MGLVAGWGLVVWMHYVLAGSPAKVLSAIRDLLNELCARFVEFRVDFVRS